MNEYNVCIILCATIKLMHMMNGVKTPVKDNASI